MAIKRELYNEAVTSGKKSVAGGFGIKDTKTGDLLDYGSLNITVEREKNKGGRPKESMKHLAVFAFCKLHERRTELKNGVRRVDEAKNLASKFFGYPRKTAIYPPYNKGKELALSDDDNLVGYFHSIEPEDKWFVFIGPKNNFFIETQGGQSYMVGKSIYFWEEGTEAALIATVRSLIEDDETPNILEFLKTSAEGFE